jgi:hypothetical protein
LAWSKDTTLNYAQRRGLDVGKRGRRPTEQELRQGNERDIAPIERFKRAQRDFIKVSGRFDLDRNEKMRAGFWQEMKSAAGEI